MTFDNPLLIWFHEFKEAQKIEEIEDLNRDFEKLIDKVERQKKLTKEDDKEFQRIISTQYKRIIIKKCSKLEGKIKKRKTRGQPFSNLLKKINTLRRNSEQDDTFVADFIDIIGELDDIEPEIKEKILIEIIIDAGLIVGIIALVFAVITFVL